VGHGRAGKGITFHPTEALAVTTSEDSTIRFWSLEDGSEVQRIMTPQGGSEDAMYSPDGRFFVTALEDPNGTVQIRDTRNTRIVQAFELGARTYSVDFSTQGSRLCVSGVGLLKVWTYEHTATFSEPIKVNLKPIKTVRGPDMGSVTVVKFSPNGRYLAWFETGPENAGGWGAWSNGIRIWDFERDRELPHRIMAYNAWNSFDFMENGTQMAVAGLRGGIEVWDFVRGERAFRLEGWEAPAVQIDVSSDGRLLAFDTRSRNFGVFDLEKRRLLFMSPELSNRVWQMRWNQDATRLGMIEGNGRARILNITAIRSKLGELGLDW
jgi:WD40 repeat protein